SAPIPLKSANSPGTLCASEARAGSLHAGTFPAGASGLRRQKQISFRTEANTMARKHLISLAALALITAATGCVSQEKYNALKLDRDRYAEQLGQAQNEASSARSEADAYKNQLAAIGNNVGGKDGMILNLTNQNSELQKQIDELNRRYADAVSKVGAASPLPAQLTNDLSEFARQNPDLVDFDAARGIVKFKSDVTFSPGSSEVTRKAKVAIARFSQIVNSATAAGYE